MTRNWVSISIGNVIKENEGRTLAQEGKDKRFGQVIGFDEESIEYVKKNQARLFKKYGRDYLIVEKNKITSSGKRLQNLVDSLGSQANMKIIGRRIVIGRVEGIVRYDPCPAVKMSYSPVGFLSDRVKYSGCYSCS